MARTKQQKELIVLLALVVVAAVVWYVYFGHHQVTGSASANEKYEPINAVDYQTVFDGLKAAESTEYKPSGRNIFVAGPAAPVTPATSTGEQKPLKPAFQKVGPDLPAPPPPPVLTWKFFGYGMLPSNGARSAFLLEGEDLVHIVGEGDTVQKTLRITHIGNDRIEYEDINTGLKNSSPLETPPPA